MPRIAARFALSFACLLLLAACVRGDGVRERVFPPSASIQELVQTDAEHWTLKLRLQNFSNVAMRFEAVEATLKVGQIEVGRLVVQVAIDVPGNSADVVETLIVPPAAARAAIDAVWQSRAGIRYVLKGQIRSSQPRERRDEFEFESSLSPAPGLSGVLR